MTLVGSSLIAILTTLFCIWLLRPLAIRIGFVDKPGGRKQHLKEVPLIGGIALFCGFCFASLSLPMSLQGLRALIAGSGLLIILGVVDDFRELSSKLRLFAQIGAALCLAVWGNLQASHLGNLLFWGDIHLGFWAIPFTVMLVVGYLNAMNMIDGQDGLAGGIALGQVLLLSYLSWYLNEPVSLTILIIVGLLLIVFLGFNLPLPGRKQAIIFLGDAGSTFIAFVVAWFAIYLGQSHPMNCKPIVILWILAFPVFDLFQVCVQRFKNRQPLLSASLDHLHYVLKTAGCKVPLSTAILILFSFSLGLLGILLNQWQVNESWQFMAWLAALVLYFFIVKIARKWSKNF